MTREHCNSPVLTDGLISCKEIALVLFNGLGNLLEKQMVISIPVHLSALPALAPVMSQSWDMLEFEYFFVASQGLLTQLTKVIKVMSISLFVVCAPWPHPSSMSA